MGKALREPGGSGHVFLAIIFSTAMRTNFSPLPPRITPLPFCPPPGTKPGGNSRAFSLIELLIVIAVIAVIAAISIPNIVNITQSAKRATLVQNAQRVALTYTAYSTLLASAGQTPDSSHSTAEGAVSAIIGTNGLTVVNSRLGVTNFFRVPISSISEIAMDKLVLTNGQLIFDEGL